MEKFRDESPTGTAQPASTSRGKREAIALSVCYLLCALHFSDVATTLVIGVMTACAYQVFYKRNRKVIAVVLSAILSLLAFSFFGKIVIRRAIAITNETDVDHRMKPDKAKGINPDGLRCAYEAGDFTRDTFNIIFLGDSFTYGQGLEQPDTAFPQAVERLVGETHPARRVRTINFGWVTSSPLLSLRLLLDVGAKYKPSLVILALDITDFHDDIRYAYCDREDVLDVSPIEFVLARTGLGDAYGQLKQRWEWARHWQRLVGENILVPADHYFIVNQPLDASRPFLGDVESNIRAIARYCNRELQAPFILVLLPRYIQTSDKECLHDNDRRRYTVFGRYVNEPERWLSEFRQRVNFPCHSLLEDFKAATAFPLCFDTDPHWTPLGHQVAAQGILRILRQEGYTK